MPKAKPQRCVFKESGRRCVRDGTGSPPVCPAHRVVFQSVARSQDDSPASKRVLDLFEDLLNGRSIRRDDVIGAAKDFFDEWQMGGGMAAGFHPPIQEDGRSAHQGQGSRFTPPPNWQGSWPGGGQRHRQPPPPPPDHQAELERRARGVLGFAASEPLTEDVIAKRRRELAKRYHPDRGGSVEKMATVNDAADVLFASL